MTSLKDILSKKLTKKELAGLKTSFDVIGSKETGAVAVIEIPDTLKRKKKTVGKAVMEVQPNVRSVLWKKSERQDAFRLREYDVIAGDKNTEVVHKENNVRILLDPQKVFFSPRESTERARISSMVKPRETVMIFFSGAGPYAINIAKKVPSSKVYGIEINPDGVSYANRNIKLNKLNNVQFILGDVREEYAIFKGKCNRVVMPLARHAHEYLDEAIQVLKKNGVIHFYHTGPEEDPFKEAVNLLKKSAEKFNRKVKISGKRLMSPYASRVWKIVIDATLS